MDGYKLNFTDKILDNVHGFIEYTDVEREIIELPVFKRLQSIKQLSLTNWIFPGAEHTRFIHSLGVMHIADQMAIQLRYTDEERQLVRLAGLLHDLGHYPLSHVGERAYMQLSEKPEDILGNQKRKVISRLAALSHRKMDFMQEASNSYHHERITEAVIRSDREIPAIIEKYCGGSRLINIDNICSIIVGSTQRNPEISGLVQLVHSELDADRIDYIMRDATFSGTSYGSFELGLFLRSLTRTSYKGAEIVGVHAKGISIADQFLMNRYYSFTQVFFNRHVSILEFMAGFLSEQFIQREQGEYPSRERLLEWIKGHHTGTDFLYFTDRAFWDSLHHADLSGCPAGHLLGQKLLRYQELDLTKNREICITFSSSEELLRLLGEHAIYQNLMDPSVPYIPILCIEKFTEQIPVERYEGMLRQMCTEGGISEADAQRMRIHRLQEGITIIEEGREPMLLADSPASLMSRLYDTGVCILREYQPGVPCQV